MTMMFLECYLLLIRIELLKPFGKLPAIYNLVRACGIAQKPKDVSDLAYRLCRAMDFACVFYPKRVLCLQRSVATTLLLRRYGLSAEMVIGAQTLPFRSHAWVEINNEVVNDKPYMLELYRPLERM